MYYFTELKPKLYNQKSYYNKAIIEHTDEYFRLISYDTGMVIISDNKIVYLNENPENYTQTTLKHVKDFLYQTLGLTNLTKAALLDLSKEF